MRITIREIPMSDKPIRVKLRDRLMNNVESIYIVDKENHRYIYEKNPSVTWDFSEVDADVETIIRDFSIRDFSV
jgi:hypothetical protein